MKTLQNCSDCGNAHPPKGGRPCTYKEEAKKAAIAAGSDGDWKLYLNLDRISVDCTAYMGEDTEEEREAWDPKLISTLISESRECRKVMKEQMHMINTLVKGLAVSRSAPAQVGSRASGTASVGGGKGAEGRRLSVNPFVYEDGTVVEEDIFDAPIGDQPDQLSEEAKADQAQAVKNREFLKALLGGMGGQGGQEGLGGHGGGGGDGRKAGDVPMGMTFLPSQMMGNKPGRTDIFGGSSSFHNSPAATQHQGCCAAKDEKRKLATFNLDSHMPGSRRKYPTINDIVSAHLSLLNSMLAHGGIDVYGYSKHIRFLSDKIGIYEPEALIAYDLGMRERAEEHGMGVFCYGDHDLFTIHIGVENIDFASIQSSYRGGGRGRGRGRGNSNSNQGYNNNNNQGNANGNNHGQGQGQNRGGGGGGGRQGGRNQGGFPGGLDFRTNMCFAYNEQRGCRYMDCRFAHACLDCKGNHPKFTCKGGGEG